MDYFLGKDQLQTDLRYYKVIYTSLSGSQTFECPPDVVSDVNPARTNATVTSDFQFTLVADKDKDQKYLDIIMSGVGVNPGNTDKVKVDPKKDCSPAIQLTKEVVITIEPDSEELVVDVTPQPETVNQERQVTDSTQTSTGFTVELSEDPKGSSGGKASVSYNVTKAKSMTMNVKDFNVVQTSTTNRPSWTFYATTITNVPDLSVYTFAPHIQCSFRVPANFAKKVPVILTIKIQLWWFQAKCPKDHGAKQVDFSAPYPNNGALTISKKFDIDFSLVSV